MSTSKINTNKATKKIPQQISLLITWSTDSL